MQKISRNSHIPTDLRTVKINRSETSVCRMADYLSQVRNPYVFRVDETVAMLEFSGDKELSRLLTDIIVSG